MTTAVQRRRGTNTEHATFTGLDGEITVNTTTYTLHVHDGATVGGIVLAKADGSNIVTSSIDINGGTIDGTVIGGSSAAAGTFTTLTASGEITANGGIALGDNDKATFGASGDLEIYHTGTTSYIRDVGDGDLQLFASDDVYIRGYATNNYMARFRETGSVDLYHNNSLKFQTTSTGIDVTGTVTADGLSVENLGNTVQQSIYTSDNVSNATAKLSFGTTPGSREKARIEMTNTNTGNAAGSLTLLTNDGSSLNDRLLIESTGDISFYEDTGTTAKFFWDASAESLGIGTASPASALDVAGTVTADGLTVEGTSVMSRFRTGSATDGRIEFAYNTTDIGYINMQSASVFDITARSGVDLSLGAGGLERMRITSSGALNIGVSSEISSATNTANGFTFSPSSGYAWLSVSDSGGIYVQRQDDNDVFSFYRATANVGSISVTSSATVYNTLSDQRLKDNITDAPSSSDDIDAIQVRSFDWKADGSHQKYGMIAQELMTVAPEAVSGDPESDEMMGVDYSKLVPMLVKEIQSLRARVAQLETN